MLCAVLAVANSLPASLEGQAFASAQSQRLGPRFLHIDSIEVGFRSMSIWRGMKLGSHAVGGALDLALWRIDGVQDRHALVAGASADFPLEDRSGDSRRDHAEIGGGYRYRLDTEQGEVKLRFVTLTFAGVEDTRHSQEIFGEIRRRIDAPLTELRPLVSVAVARDLDEFNATYVEPEVSLDLGLPRGNNAFSFGGRVALATSWSDYPKDDESSTAFGYHSTRIGLWIAYDRSSTPVGPLLVEVGGEHWWSAVGNAPRHLVGIVRLVKR
jgi:hypothetical protein